MSGGPISAPSSLRPDHDLSTFDCGEPTLNDWLKQRALKNERVGASKTFVVCRGNEVVGFYCLSTGAVVRAAAPKPLQRNMPDPIPVLVLGRLAVDRNAQGMGIGRALLRDALLRSLRVAESVGVTAVLVHAISEDAKRFYLANGFLESPIEPMTLCLPISLIAKSI